MRIYNGQPDDELQAKLDQEAAARKAVLALNPHAHLTYFPMEEAWQWHEWGKDIGEMCDTVMLACESAIKALTQNRTY